MVLSKKKVNFLVQKIEFEKVKETVLQVKSTIRRVK